MAPAASGSSSTAKLSAWSFRRHHALGGGAVLEFVDLVGGLDDRASQAKHVEALAVGPAVVANQGDDGVALLADGVAAGATLAIREVTGGVDERVERRRRNNHRAAALDFLKNRHGDSSPASTDGPGRPAAHHIASLNPGTEAAATCYNTGTLSRGSEAEV
jgi:hypothetical protein